MLRAIAIGMGLALAWGSYVLPAAVQEPPEPTPSEASSQRAVLDTYCVTCHDQTLQTAGLMLDMVDVENLAEDATVWEKVVRKLRTNAMPPVGMPRPDDAKRDALATYLERGLDRAAEEHPNPGRLAVHRMNRNEYTNAIRDLLAIDPDAIDIPSLLPADDSGYGFDNIADVLTVSKTLMEAYISTSRKISRLAIGDATLRPVIETYEIPRYVVQDDRMSEDLPFGSRGGIAISHHFPLDAEYHITIRLQRNRGRAGGLDVVFGLEDRHQLDVRLDGKVIERFTIGGEQVGTGTQAEEDLRDAGLEVRIPVHAGTHVIGVSFLNQITEPENIYQPPITDYSNAISYGFDAVPAIGKVIVDGPYDVKGVGETPSRRRIFVCRPATVAEELPCASEILTELARRAYRGSVTEQDLQSLLDLYKQGRGLDQEWGSFDRGIETALQRILVDPEFLFRIERDSAEVAPNTAYRISARELASRLSFFLWSSIPDDALLELVEQGKLMDPAVLEQQVQRMLGDPRSKALVENFAGQWLYLRNVQASWPNPEIFPDFTTSLRDDFQQETELFFESMIREDRSVLDLLRADYTFLNERLARHYGVPNIYGNRFRRVTLSDDNRKGLLGQGSILMVTSYATRTAPTIRGRWLLENLLGTPPPPPPPNVPSLDESKGSDGKALTVRQQLEQHRVNPACASCHKIMDPLGLALENFDATGRWRTTEGGIPIDASGEFPNGSKFEGPAELRELLLSQPYQIVYSVTEKLLTYALGRGVEYYDAPVIRRIVREAASEDYAWSSVILGIVKSMPFQMRKSSS